MSRNKLRLLLVEDVPADAELITYELRKANIAFESRCVASKKEFLKELRAKGADAIISDYSLPQFNALDALQALKSHASDIPFILVTGTQSEEVAVECIKEGADDYILKSSLKRLPTALQSALHRRVVEREREHAQKALRHSEEYFRSLIDASTDIITILSGEGLIRFESPSLTRVLGYEPNELVGKRFADFVHPADLPMFDDFFQEELRGISCGRPVECRFCEKSGEWRYLETVCRNYLHNPAVAGLVLNSRDVTERKRAEERIHEQAALLNKAQDAIMVVDLRGTVTFWNRSAERLYGWKTEEVTGLKTADDLYALDLGRLREAREQTCATGEWHGEIKQTTADGKELVMESRWSLVRGPDQLAKSFLIINTDITERRRLEAHFLRAQRMESIGTLAGGIAHDLNNVLTPIIMSLKLLRDVKAPPPADLLETLESSAHRGAAIVQQVLSFARGVEGERSILQLKHPLNEVIKIARDVFPPSIQIKPTIVADLWPVQGDPTQLHQVFMNLFVNARDAMPNGGKLLVDAQNVTLDENFARMKPECTPGPHIVVTIVDSGAGIPAEVIGKIFEPFFTTKEPGKGTGLGLSTALGIVRSHGGFITVYSEQGKGSCFKVYLPAAPTNAQEKKTVSEQVLPLGRGETILVVDDEAAIRQIIKVTLQNHGYQVVTANDGTEAVAVFASHPSKIEAAIVDVMMPYMDGLATIRALQRLHPELRCIAISGLLESTRVAQISELGNVSFLAKPFTTEQVLQTLSTLFSERYFPGPIPAPVQLQ